MLETASGHFHGAGYFFGGIFTMLETSSRIFKVLEASGNFMVLQNSCGEFFGEIFTVLETSWIFTVLETSLEGF